MFTPDSLLEMAVAFEAQADLFHDLGNKANAGERSDYFGKAYDFRRKAMEATTCAEWMENHGISEAPMIGPFGNIKIEQHTKVRIKAGALIFGFGSEFKTGPKTNKRAYTVTVDRCDRNGFAVDATNGHRGKAEVRNQQVHWAGTGGYWRWTDASNVEVLS